MHDSMPIYFLLHFVIKSGLSKKKKEHSMALTMHCSFAQATGRISLDAPPWFSHFRRQLHRVPFIYFR